jgi:hypothetical protein
MSVSNTPDRRNLATRTDILALVFFLILTLVMTYPLVLHLGSGVRDLGLLAISSSFLAAAPTNQLCGWGTSRFPGSEEHLFREF